MSHRVEELEKVESWSAAFTLSGAGSTVPRLRSGRVQVEHLGQVILYRLEIDAQRLDRLGRVARRGFLEHRQLLPGDRWVRENAEDPGAQPHQRQRHADQRLVEAERVAHHDLQFPQRVPPRTDQVQGAPHGSGCHQRQGEGPANVMHGNGAKRETVRADDGYDGWSRDQVAQLVAEEVVALAQDHVGPQDRPSKNRGPHQLLGAPLRRRVGAGRGGAGA